MLRLISLRTYNQHNSVQNFVIIAIHQLVLGINVLNAGAH